MSGQAQRNHGCICTAQHLASVTEPEVGLVSLFHPWAAKMLFLTGCQSSSLSLRMTDSLTNQKPQRKSLNFLLFYIDGRPHCCCEIPPFLRKVGLPDPCLPLKPDSTGHACCSSQQLSHPGQFSDLPELAFLPTQDGGDSYLTHELDEKVKCAATGTEIACCRHIRQTQKT